MVESDWEVLRIENGIPRWGRELTPEIIPPEANLAARAIDYEKGCYIGQEKGFWLVPSQSSQGRYRVLDGDHPTCSCPDYENRGEKCKHIFAVEYIVTAKAASK